MKLKTIVETNSSVTRYIVEVWDDPTGTGGEEVLLCRRSARELTQGELALKPPGQNSPMTRAADEAAEALDVLANHIRLEARRRDRP